MTTILIIVIIIINNNNIVILYNAITYSVVYIQLTSGLFIVIVILCLINLSYNIINTNIIIIVVVL